MSYALNFSAQVQLCIGTASNRFSGHGYNGNDHFSGTKKTDNAILFTKGGITVIVKNFGENFDADLSKVGILKLIKLKVRTYFQKIRWCMYHNL